MDKIIKLAMAAAVVLTAGTAHGVQCPQNLHINLSNTDSNFIKPITFPNPQASSSVYGSSQGATVVTYNSGRFNTKEQFVNRVLTASGATPRFTSKNSLGNTTYSNEVLTCAYGKAILLEFHGIVGTPRGFDPDGNCMSNNPAKCTVG